MYLCTNKQNMISSRHRFIQFYINNNPGFEENSLRKIFDMSENCYKFVCDVLIDNNYDNIHNVDKSLKQEEHDKCLETIYLNYATSKNFIKAKYIVDIIVGYVDNVVKSLMCRYKYEYIKIHSEKRQIVLPSQKILLDKNYEPKNEIENVCIQLFNILNRKKNIDAYYALMNIYNNHHDELDTKYFLNVFTFVNSCYGTTKDKDMLMDCIVFHQTLTNKNYEFLVKHQLHNNNLLDRYWNLAHIEMTYNENKNNYALIHYVNYFYELFDQEYDDNILNYNSHFAQKIRHLLYETIYLCGLDINMRHESNKLYTKSKTNVTDLFNYLARAKKNNFKKNTLIKSLRNEKSGKRCFVDNCCFCKEYSKVFPLSICKHNMCYECYSFILDDKCPECRHTMQFV